MSQVQNKSQNQTTKEYVLLDHLAPTAPIYMQVGKNERVRLNVMKSWRPYLVATIIDENGESKVIRLKLGAKSIFLTDQIKDGIPANAKTTNAERDAVHFRNGRLVSSIAIVHEFFSMHPQFNEFKGTSPEGIKPAFKLYERATEIKNDNLQFKTRLKAANKINRMTLLEAQEMLIRINGSMYTVPTDLEECQNELVDLMDDSNEALFEILKENEDRSVSDKVNVLIGKLVNANLISFVAIENHVAVKRDGLWVELLPMSAEYKDGDRQKYLVDFLLQKRGEPMLDDLNSMLEKYLETEKV